ncbi:MAG: hypothetical protein F6K65_27280 [Moorea sp. SIO3C2]|nr:hypothetical protein [Moorena sp. SIO3C2]
MQDNRRKKAQEHATKIVPPYLPIDRESYRRKRVWIFPGTPRGAISATSLIFNSFLCVVILVEMSNLSWAKELMTSLTIFFTAVFILASISGRKENEEVWDTLAIINGLSLIGAFYYWVIWWGNN